MSAVKVAQLPNRTLSHRILEISLNCSCLPGFRIGGLSRAYYDVHIDKEMHKDTHVHTYLGSGKLSTMRDLNMS